MSPTIQLVTLSSTNRLTASKGKLEIGEFVIATNLSIVDRDIQTVHQ
jgi:hypothetical protein